MHNNTGIVYLTKDAKLIARTNPKIDRIIVFSPDCYEILKVKYKNIVKPSIYFTPTKITESTGVFFISSTLFFNASKIDSAIALPSTIMC